MFHSLKSAIFILLASAAMAGCGKWGQSPSPFKSDTAPNGYTKVLLGTPKSDEFPQLFQSTSNLNPFSLPSTSSNFPTAYSLGSDVFGKVAVYAVRTDGTYAETLFMDGESDNVASDRALTLQNGTYNFYVVAWAANNVIYDAGLTRRRCGQALNTSLSGDTTTLSIRVSVARCLTSPGLNNTSLLSYDAVPQVAMPMLFYSCTNSAALPGPAASCGGLCSSCFATPGTIGSFKISMQDYTYSDGTFTEKSTNTINGCVAAGGGGASSSGPIEVPLGNTIQAGYPRLRTKIEAYMGSADCTTGPIHTYQLNNGIYELYGAAFDAGGGNMVEGLPEDINQGFFYVYFDR